MSFTIFMISVVATILTIIISCVIDSYSNKKHVIPVMCSGLLLAFLFFILSLCFSNMKHMIASIKYDHVVVLDFKQGTRPTRSIDQNKVIYQCDYTIAPSCYTLVIMAWNDEKTIDQYDKLTREN